MCLTGEANQTAGSWGSAASRGGGGGIIGVSQTVVGVGDDQSGDEFERVRTVAASLSHLVDDVIYREHHPTHCTGSVWVRRVYGLECIRDTIR